MSARRIRAALALVVTGCTVVLLAGCGDSGDSVGDPPDASPSYDQAAATAGAAWLVGHLDGGLLSYRTDFGPFTDHGLSIDAALALAEIGGHDQIVQQIGDAVAKDLDSYITGAAFGDPDSTYAGPAAKALVMAELAGADPTAYGGIDLVARVESVTTDGGPSTGRIADVSSFGDNANVLGQAYAVQGLSGADSPRAADALAFLLHQQCSDGFFRLSFTKDAKATDQTCDGGSAKESQPDVDSTAVAVLALLPEADQPEVEDALARATTWLVGQQSAEGAFHGSGDTAAENANSTGLAGWALGEHGDAEAAQSAASWVRSLQAGGDGECGAWGADAGAIAYDAAVLEAGSTSGITKGTEGQWLRSTAQALPVLQWAPTDGESSPCPAAG